MRAFEWLSGVAASTLTTLVLCVVLLDAKTAVASIYAPIDCMEGRGTGVVCVEDSSGIGCNIATGNANCDEQHINCTCVPTRGDQCDCRGNGSP
jgi:hypothetical protein